MQQVNSAIGANNLRMTVSISNDTLWNEHKFFDSELYVYFIPVIQMQITIIELILSLVISSEIYTRINRE